MFYFLLLVECLLRLALLWKQIPHGGNKYLNWSGQIRVPPCGLLIVCPFPLNNECAAIAMQRSHCANFSKSLQTQQTACKCTIATILVLLHSPDVL